MPQMPFAQDRKEDIGLRKLRGKCVQVVGVYVSKVDGQPVGPAQYGRGQLMPALLDRTVSGTDS